MIHLIRFIRAAANKVTLQPTDAALDTHHFGLVTVRHRRPGTDDPYSFTEIAGIANGRETAQRPY
jgi:hypothetical protein